MTTRRAPFMKDTAASHLRWAELFGGRQFCLFSQVGTFLSLGRILCLLVGVMKFKIYSPTIWKSI
jgi:hypothetical protein